MEAKSVIIDNMSFSISQGYITGFDESKQYNKDGGFLGYTRSGLIAGVLSDFSKDQYPWLIRAIMNDQGLGALGGAYVYSDLQKQAVLFSHDFDNIKYKQEVNISYVDGIKLFHAFFNAFKKYVDETSPEITGQKRMFYTGKRDEKGEPIYGDFPWYPDFLKELENLNKHYAELVAKGEIKE